MTHENSTKIADYIIRVIDLLKDNLEVYSSNSENRYCVAYHESDEDEIESKMLIYSSELEGIKLAFSQFSKNRYKSLGFEKDDYFNCSVENDLILDYDNLKRVLDHFCNTDDVIVIRMKYKIIESIVKGELDEHSPVPGIRRTKVDLF